MLRVLVEVPVVPAVTDLELRLHRYPVVLDSRPLSPEPIDSLAAGVAVVFGPVLAQPVVSVVALPVALTTVGPEIQLLPTLVQVVVVQLRAVSTVATVDLDLLLSAMTHRTSLPKSALQPKPLVLSATPRSTHS